MSLLVCIFFSSLSLSLFFSCILILDPHPIYSGYSILHYRKRQLAAELEAANMAHAAAQRIRAVPILYQPASAAAAAEAALTYYDFAGL